MSVSLSLESLPLSLLLLSRLSLSTTCLSPWCLSLEVQYMRRQNKVSKGSPVSVEAMPQIRIIAATSAPPITITMVSLLPTVPSSSSVVASPVVTVSFSTRFFLSPPRGENGVIAGQCFQISMNPPSSLLIPVFPVTAFSFLPMLPPLLLVLLRLRRPDDRALS